jgi:hypothetical protein
MFDSHWIKGKILLKAVLNDLQAKTINSKPNAHLDIGHSLLDIGHL